MIDHDACIERGMTADELRLIREKVERRPYAKKGRYGNVAQRTEYNGQRYDSKAEANYAARLDYRVSIGLLSWWIRQVWIPLGPDFRTRIDFLVACKREKELVEIHAHEVKGVETREFKKVRELWPKYGPFSLFVIKFDNIELIEGKS